MATGSKKVGGSKAGSKVAEKEKAGKTPMDYSNYKNAEGQSIVNEDGKLLEPPVRIESEDGTVVQAGWDPKKNKPLGKDDFATEAPFLRWKADTLRQRAERSLVMADRMDAKAERLGRFKSDKARKKAEKLARMKEQMAALEAELANEGVDAEEV